MLRYLDEYFSTLYPVVPGFIWSTWPHNNSTNLYNFRFVLILVCFSPQIFCHRLARSTSTLDFLFSNFGFGVFTANNVMSCFSAQRRFLPKTQLGIRFQQPSLIESLYFLILTICLRYWTRFCSQQQQCLVPEILDRALRLSPLCILSVNSILARCVALEIYRFLMKIFTHIPYKQLR